MFYNVTMSASDNKDSNKKVHAMVITTQKVIDLMGKDLLSHFVQHKVSLVNVMPAVAYGPDAMSLVLEGKQGNIKKSLEQLKKLCLVKESGIESSPAKSLPPILKGYLSDMENDISFEKIFSYCSKEYLDYCKAHNISPHPEVVEAIK